MRFELDKKLEAVDSSQAGSGADKDATDPPPRQDLRRTKACVGMKAFALFGGALLLVWLLFRSPDIGEHYLPPVAQINEENTSVYFGNGCFWHTQYDTYQVERAPPFSRTLARITSLVGYAGSKHTSPTGQVCYHGGPSGSLYEDLGHAEVVQVQLDAASGPVADAQFTALLRYYFTAGFTAENTRLDPQDSGPPYRAVIGIPGGTHGPLYPLIAKMNARNMPIAEGKGGPREDLQDERLAYVYDSLRYHFYRGEAYHQFHVNRVLGRPVPSAYTGDLKRAQEGLGRLKSMGCV